MKGPILITKNTEEPPAGTVVIRDGLTGTVYQKFYSDGKFHSVTGSVEEWSYFINRFNPKLTGDFILLEGED